MPTRSIAAPTAGVPSLEVGAESISHARSIPSLDGLRTVAIALVLLAHCGESLLKSPIAVKYAFELGEIGVSLFFVISGFLITFLLDREKSSTGTIDLGSFYLRRTFRIFPPFYVYLLVVVALWANDLAVHLGGLLAAATYTSNYYLHPMGRLLASTWSLSLEEQFYLFWPFCLKFLARQHARLLALCLIALMPLSRALTFYYFPALHAAGIVSMMFQTRLDTMMFGCLLALFWRSEKFADVMQRRLHPLNCLAAWVLGLVVLPLLTVFWRWNYYRLFYLTLTAMALTWGVIYVVKIPNGVLGRFLNLRPIKYVGVLSYSLYLYQQIFTGHLNRFFPFNLAGAFAAALCSYHLVEKPSLRLRDHFTSGRRQQPVESS